MEKQLTKPSNLLNDFPQLKETIEKSGLKEKDATNYLNEFIPFISELTVLSSEMKNINFENPSPEDSEKAKELRIRFMKNRTGSEKMKKALKEMSLKTGNFIQGIYNVIESNSSPNEEKLDYVEKYAEKKEAERKESLRKSRALELGQYMSNTEMFPLGEISEEAYQEMLKGQIHAKKAKEEEENISTLQQERQGQLFPYRELFEQQQWDLFSSENYLGKLHGNDWVILLCDSKKAQEEKDAYIKLEQEKQKIINERLRTISGMGFVYDTVSGTHNLEVEKNVHAVINEADLNATQENFDKIISGANNIIELIEKTKQETIQKQNMLRDVRLKYFKEIEFVPNDHMKKDLGTISENDFRALFDNAKDIVKNKKENEKLQVQLKQQEEEKKHSRLKRLEKYGFALSEAEIVSMLKMTEDGFDNYISTLERGYQEAEKEKEAAKGDKEKMQGFVKQLESFISGTSQLEFKSKKYKNAHSAIELKLAALKENINSFLNPSK